MTEQNRAKEQRMMAGDATLDIVVKEGLSGGGFPRRKGTGYVRTWGELTKNWTEGRCRTPKGERERAGGSC